MWFLGAGYTLAAIEAVWPNAFEQMGLLKWVVPVIISIIEVLAVDHAKSRETSQMVLVVLAILALLDLGSTIYGIRLSKSTKII